jgi:hypothetical protein
MREFNLGIVGGCLSHQVGIPHRQLYHQHLALMTAQRWGLNLKVHIARDFVAGYPARVRTLLGRERLDAILVHVRFNLHETAGILLRQNIGSQQTVLLHPFLFRRHKSGLEKLRVDDFKGCLVLSRSKIQIPREANTEKLRPSGDTKHPDSGNPEEWDPYSRRLWHDRPPWRSLKRAFGGGVRTQLWNLNSIAGVILGMRRWAEREESRLITEAQSVARAANVPLVVMGPMRFANNPVADYLNRWCCAAYAKITDVNGIPFCALGDLRSPTGESYYIPNGIHLSRTGHRYVGHRLATTFAPIFEATQAALRGQALSHALASGESPTEIIPRASARPSDEAARPGWSQEPDSENHEAVAHGLEQSPRR